jgi:hypothetical protein
MSISHRYHAERAKLALELTMRDALAGLEELANLDSHWFDTNCLEILGIESPRTETRTTESARPCVSATILNFPEQRRRIG